MIFLLKIRLGDTVTKVLHRLWPTIPHLFQNRYIIIFLCSCFVTLPLSLYRNIAKLSRVSLVGLILVFITILILIKRGYDTVPFMYVNKIRKFYISFAFRSPEIRNLRLVDTNIAESIGVMAYVERKTLLRESFSVLSILRFAFMCQHNSFLIFHSMKEKSLARWRTVTLITVITAFAFTIIYGLTGYIVFGQQTEGNFHLNFYTFVFI